MANLLKKMEPIIPSEQDMQLAVESSRALSSLLGKDTKDLELVIKDKHSSVVIGLPVSLLKILFSMLTQMSEGNAVTVIPVHAELTTQEAANLLNVSRPFLIGLLEKNKMPYRKVGTRRKILFKDLMSYKDSMYNARMKTLDDLSKDAQDLNMGY